MKVAYPILLVLVLSACEQSPPPSSAPAERKGRAETENIRNLDAVGVPGGAIADKVDGALNAAEQRQQQLESQEPN